MRGDRLWLLRETTTHDWFLEAWQIVAANGTFVQWVEVHVGNTVLPPRLLAHAWQDTHAPACWLVQLDARLVATGHLLGRHGTLADMAIAPFVRQFAAIDSGWWAAQPWPHLQAWLARWLASPLLGQVMHKYPPWQEGTPGVLFAAPPGATHQP